jgi:hypothetical protein
VGHWWNLDRLEMPSRRSSVCVLYSVWYWQMLHRRNKQTFKLHIKEHQHNLTQSLLEKSKVAQHAYEGGHKIWWKEAKVLQTEPNTTYRKNKESAHMSLAAHPFRQPSLDISPIRTPTIGAGVRKLQFHPVEVMWESCVFMLVLHRICLFSVGFYFDSTLIL